MSQQRQTLGLSAAPAPTQAPAAVAKPQAKIEFKTVRAIETGFYDGSIVEVGTVFDVPVSLTGSWLKDVEEGASILVQRAKDRLDNAKALAGAGQAPRAIHPALQITKASDIIPGTDLA